MTERNSNLRDEQIAALRVRELELWFPGRLTESDREQIGDRYRTLIDAIATIRRHPVANADEPALTFRAIGKDQR